MIIEKFLKDKLKILILNKIKDIPGGRESVADKQGSSKTKKEKESVASVQPAVTNLKKEKSKEPLTSNIENFKLFVALSP